MVRAETAEGTVSINWNALTPEEEADVLACADMSLMHLAPAEVIGPYCCQDADSTYLLYTQVLLPAVRAFTALERYASPEVYGEYLRILIEQRLAGILIDRSRLEEYSAQLQVEIAAAKENFFAQPQVQSAVKEWNRRIVEEIYKQEPVKFLKQKAPPKEPAKYTKSGKISGSWTRWQERSHLLSAAKPVVSKNWSRWWQRLLEAMDAQHFNLDSGPQKQWLFYEYLKHPVELETESGQPAVDERALKMMGEAGACLNEYGGLKKEYEYVDATIGFLREDNANSSVRIIRSGDARRTDAGPAWYVHPSWRAPGTLTGRLAGSNPNIQQSPKVRRYLDWWVAPPGRVFLEFDFESLEQVVLAELSKDATLWKLYGPGSKPQDVYLFNGAALPVIGDRIRAAGYDVDNPTKEMIDRVKGLVPKERAIAKVVTLGASYGMGAGKLQRTLRVEGVDVSFDEARRIHSGYWELYRGVKKYEAELLRQYELNDGWVLNGIGRPVGVAAGYEKDIVNRVCQSTGHDLLVLFLVRFVVPSLQEAGIPFVPVIADWHDEFIIEINEIYAEQAQRIVDTVALPAFNAEIAGEIPLKGSATISRNLADAKGLKK